MDFGRFMTGFLVLTGIGEWIVSSVASPHGLPPATLISPTRLEIVALHPILLPVILLCFIFAESSSCR